MARDLSRKSRAWNRATRRLSMGLLPSFPNVDTLLQLQGERIVADETSLSQQNAVGLITSSELATQAPGGDQRLDGRAGLFAVDAAVGLCLGNPGL